MTLAVRSITSGTCEGGGGSDGVTTKAAEDLFLCCCWCDSRGIEGGREEEVRPTKLAVKSCRCRPFTRAAASYFSCNMRGGDAQLLPAAFILCFPRPCVCYSRHVGRQKHSLAPVAMIHRLIFRWHNRRRCLGSCYRWRSWPSSLHSAESRSQGMDQPDGETLVSLVCSEFGLTVWTQCFSEKLQILRNCVALL